MMQRKLVSFLRSGLLLALLAGCAATPPRHQDADVGVGVGIHVPAYPHLVRVPGHPVYYAPYVNLNLFFYDGLYWIFHGGRWYVGSWYNGPWHYVQPRGVPLYVLRVPLRYYRQPPPAFRHWRGDAPPRWEQHWGREWEHRRDDWSRLEQRPMPEAAPLPGYQRQYHDDRYPRAAEQQRAIRSRHYRYEPREEESRRHFGR